MGLALGVTFVLIALASLYLYLQRQSSYWKRRNVPSYGNLFSGRFKETFKATKSLTDVLNELYAETKNKEKCVGTFMFGKPILVINDPEIIKAILVSDFSDFNSRGFYYDVKRDPISGNLFFLEGADWKQMRAKLSPIFTTGKIKYMFNTVLDCVRKLDSVLDKEKASVVHTRNLLSSLSIDIIASVGFGIEADCIGNPKSEFGTVCRRINNGSVVAFLRFVLQTSMHWLARLINLQALEKICDTFFKTIVREIVTHREKNDITRNDFLDLMIRLKNSGGVDGSLKPLTLDHLPKGISTDDIAAQAFLFFIAGFETTSQANTMALMELAKHQDIQRQVQQECDKILTESNGQITYEVINNGMEYTEQVLRETMRMYPGLQILIRSTVRKCKVPFTDIELDKGTGVWIPLAALHRDPDAFPEPDKFHPQRFSEENKSSIPPCFYMPFGDGPRICIGMRFAMVQMKSVIFYILSKFSVDVVEDSTLQVKLDPRTFFPNPMGNFKLKFTPRQISH